MARIILIGLLMATTLVGSGPALAHPDLTADAGVLSYVISAGLAAILFVSAYGFGRVLTWVKQ
jgi:hypothetical protein